MAENKVETVTLIAPNGQVVSVAESKMGERLAGGYHLPEPEPSAKPRRSK